MLEGYKLFCFTFMSIKTGMNYKYSCIEKDVNVAMERLKEKIGNNYRIVNVESRDIGR